VDVAAGLTGGALAAWAGVALARRSEWGIRDPAAHLAIVTLAVFLTLPLLYWDGGYPEAARFQQILGGAALAYALYVYLIRPLLAWNRHARR
jgi:hypothetical protein